MSTTPGKFRRRLPAVLAAAALARALAAGPAAAATLSGPEPGVVPYGMGRAYSAIADDWLALHYNPAGLALVRKVDVQAFDLKVESNRDVLKSFSSLKGMSGSGNLANSLNSLAGKHLMASFSDVTQITIPNFALAVIYDNHVDFDLENLSYPQTRLRYTKDLTIAGGGAISAGPRKSLRLGATLKWVTRTGADRTVPVSQIMGSKSSVSGLFSQTGSGIGGDIGMQYRIPTPGRVEYTGSFVWHDIGHTSFGGMQAVNPPTRIEQDMVAGFAVRLPIGGQQNRRLERRYGPTRSTSSLSFAFDYDHLNTSWSQEALVKHLHEGVNLDLPIFSFQLGLNQSALTFGTQFDIGIIRVSLATYGEEIGSYAGQKVDRRYVLSIGSALGFTAPGSGR